ncbi:MAG: hypothetical protein IIZ78_23910 [Clostridiales bacterium]|nr:hypothetical protein [Clostridiales bacterium]
MSLRLIQCERCKVFFEYKKENTYLIELTDKVVNRSIDLCPKCMEAFREFMGEKDKP